MEQRGTTRNMRATLVAEGPLAGVTARLGGAPPLRLHTHQPHCAVC